MFRGRKEVGVHLEGERKKEKGRVRSFEFRDIRVILCSCRGQ